MFQKVLVAEDIDSINSAVIEALNSLGIPDIQQAKYCDEAFLKLKKAIHDEAPFDLLISDLSFKTDHRETQLLSGEALIEAIKKQQPQLKTIVYSIEDKSFRIKSMFENLGINGYVLKGRNSIPELKKAIENIYATGDNFLSPEISHLLIDKSILEIEAYDIQLLKLLAQGLSLLQIVRCFREANLVPNSSSSIEKRINKLKLYFKANNNVHLIAIAKDLGLV